MSILDKRKSFLEFVLSLYPGFDNFCKVMLCIVRNPPLIPVEFHRTTHGMYCSPMTRIFRLLYFRTLLLLLLLKAAEKTIVILL